MTHGQSCCGDGIRGEMQRGAHLLDVEVSSGFDAMHWEGEVEGGDGHVVCGGGGGWRRRLAGVVGGCRRLPRRLLFEFSVFLVQEALRLAHCSPRALKHQWVAHCSLGIANGNSKLCVAQLSCSYHSKPRALGRARASTSTASSLAAAFYISKDFFFTIRFQQAACPQLFDVQEAAVATGSRHSSQAAAGGSIQRRYQACQCRHRVGNRQRFELCAKQQQQQHQQQREARCNADGCVCLIKLNAPPLPPPPVAAPTRRRPPPPLPRSSRGPRCRSVLQQPAS